MKRSIALKVSQEKVDSFSFNGEDVEVDDNDLAFLSKSFKRIFSRRRFRRGGSNNSNPKQLNYQRRKGKQETNKK